MKWNKEDILNSGILEQYVLGILEEDELREVEAMLEEHPELWNYVKDLRVTLTAVSFQNGVRPPVWTAAEREKEEPSSVDYDPAKSLATPHRSRHQWVSWSLLAALAALNIYIVTKYQDLQHRFSSLEHNYASASTKLHHQQDEHAVVLFLMDPQTTRQVISGNHNKHHCESWIFINPERELAFWQPGKMPELQSGESFRIWAEIDGEMLACSGHIHHPKDIEPLKYFSDAEKYHISIERDHQSNQPNSDQLIASGPSVIRPLQTGHGQGGSL